VTDGMNMLTELNRWYCLYEELFIKFIQNLSEDSVYVKFLVSISLVPSQRCFLLLGRQGNYNVLSG